MAYYLEKRDPEFEHKMADVLCIYKEINLQNEAGESGVTPSVITVSVDEKPGVQAIKNIAPDIMPEPGKQSRIMRDYEYKRLGTLSILAALDLHDGHVIAQVHDKHRSIEFISLLEASWVFIILPDPPSVSSWIIIPPTLSQGDHEIPYEQTGAISLCPYP